ncbi:MAG: hypothetical protein AYK22_02500 [Thermoplasmatales archaeon SG8-52-3]|nr:MAG: hypothetical protein AYK22_02500 [Thermoplasmatales archaeon SG8-52-3]
MKVIFTILFTICIILPSISNSAFTIDEFTIENEKIVGKINREIEIQAESDYYIKFNFNNLTLEDQNITSYTNGLSEKVKEAIAKSPKWIQRRLSRQFHEIDGEEYADLILDINKKYIDEIAFSIACSSINNVPPVNIIKDNVMILYENDKWIKYADIVDYDDGNGNYYSTIKYRVLENEIEKEFEYPSEIYYWYVVHPEIASENAEYIYDEFWRSYLFNHNDIGYPLLKEKLLEIEFLWDCKSYSQYGQRLWTESIRNHPTAIEAISYWIGKTVPAQAIGDRPGQPIIIAHEHNGWCGELQKLAVAAQRTSLIPSVAVSNIGEDHAWREFYERGWHQNDNWWSDTGGTVDIPDIYTYGWGKDMSSVFAWIGDDGIFEVTPTYIHSEDRNTICFEVIDRLLRPIDGARITVAVWGPNDITWLKFRFYQRLESIWDSIPPILRGKIIEFLFTKIYEKIDKIPESVDGPIYSIWNYTNIDGKCCFELGTNRSYIFIIQYGNLKKPLGLARYNKIRTLNDPIDKTYNIWLPFLSSKKLKYSDAEMPIGDVNFKVSFDTKSYQLHESILWIDDKGLYERNGKIEFFIVDEENFNKYKEGKNFNCFNFLNSKYGEFNVNAEQKDWYFVFKNRARNSNVILNFSLIVETQTSENKVKIIYPNKDIFDNPIYNIGDKIIVNGIATDNIFIYINETPYEVLIDNYEWTYEWNTSNFEPGEYLISADCLSALDEIIVKLIDKQPPEIIIDKPLDGEIVEKGIISINGHSSDNLEIEKVEVSLDNGEWKEANATNQWSIDWNLGSYDIGDHIISARAIDTAGSISIVTISLIINESGHNWGPIINSYYHKPNNPTNVSNIIIFANVSENSPYKIKKVVLIWDNGTKKDSTNMFRYAVNPVQKRHDEDPLKNQSNDPIFGLELGQIPTNTTINYFIKAFDSANNTIATIEKSFTVF